MRSAVKYDLNRRTVQAASQGEPIALAQRRGTGAARQCPGSELG